MYARLQANGFTALRKQCLLAASLVLLILGGYLPPAVHSAEDVAPYERLIIVTSGDTFSLLSLREFGTTAFGRLIAEYNRVPYNGILEVGQALRIPVSPSDAIESANVVFAKGGAVVKVRGSQQDVREVKNGDKLYVHDIIKTPETGFVSLRFPTGAVVNIQPGSVVKLLALDCLESRESCVISLDAQSGGITSNVTQRKGQPTEFRVRTPHASAAVRGTIFDITASTENMLIGVTEGIVDVTAQGESIDLFQGLGIKTRAGEKSDAPIQLLASPMFKRLPPRLTEEDTLSWNALKNANRYMLAMASDSQGVSVPYSIESTDPTHKLQPLPGGEYFAQLRAIDTEGFKGFQSQQPVLVADLDKTAFVPTLTAIPDDGELWISAADLPDNVSAYEVQLSFQSNFLEVTAVDVPIDGGVQAAATDVVTYFRARSILNATTVGSFGPVLTISAR